MNFFKIFLAALLTCAMIGLSAQEETFCPDFEGQDPPACDVCIEAGCGYTADDGDCLLSCDEVNDGAVCVAMEGSQSAADACSSSNTTSGETETFCATFESAASPPDCETCVKAGCGYTADDGDCLQSCAEVNDGAECWDDASSCGSSTGGSGSGSAAGVDASSSLSLLYLGVSAGALLMLY